ncbi:MAG: MFS transporter [Bosea sp.]|uniref:MFS transporter n=1 Tax=Bosea sp. (in: a-proteobacteria) TaxID=1871050 RepID=UPI0023831030|nr:MFS transporter [Bosea sp. (in: a-proteobacteria)]MCP4737887.1 MFS transporter [Bosea sp. (in: a-proteobacteria)]
MPNPYREIFRAPGTIGFSAAGFVARLPLSMVTIGIVTMLSQARGEYWLAGGVAATFALSNALIAPQISRLVDRHGQSKVLIPATLATIVALIGLMLATRFEAPIWVLFLFAGLAGLEPSMMAMVRARWTEIYRGTPQLRTAFAFESVVDEMVFMVGPVLAIGLSVVWFPEAGPLAATILLAVGMALFVAQRATEPPVHPQGADSGGSAIRLVPVQIIALLMVALGAVFGTAEVTAVAFAEAQGNKAAASLALAAYAAGSFITGLVFGALRLRLALTTQLLLAIGLAAMTTLPLLIVSSLWMLGVVLFIAGASISPTVIVAMALVERHAPPSKLTEGITWVMTGMGVGMALGSALSGWLIDVYGARSGFYVSVAGGFSALAIVVAGLCLLVEPRRPVGEDLDGLKANCA